MPRGPNATCSVCSKPVYRGHTSRPEIACHECRRKRRAQQGRVDVPIHATSRHCAVCGDMFLPGYRTAGKPPQRYCSKSCATKASNRARYKDKPKANGAGSKAAARRRRMIVATTWDGVTDEQILERDRWMCWICKRRIGKTFKFPHPRSASIDHELPLSLGGDDTQYNKRAAHLYCNMARQTGRPGEQMPMAFALDPDVTLVSRRKQRQPCAICSEPISGKRCNLHMPVHYCTCRYCGNLAVSRRKDNQVCASPECRQRHHYASHDRKVQAGEPHKRALEAHAMHEQGMTWGEVADRLGYPAANLAAAAAARATGKRSARKQGEYIRLPRVLVPSTHQASA